MAEEEKSQEEAKEGKSKEEKPKAEKAQKEAERKGAEEKEVHPKPSAGEKKRKKVSRMTLAEVESELKVLQEKMGGLQSDFARHLFARKKELAESHPRS